MREVFPVREFIKFTRKSGNFWSVREKSGKLYQKIKKIFYMASITRKPVGFMQSCCPVRTTCTLLDDVRTTSRPGPRQILAWVAQFYAVLHPASHACRLHIICTCHLHVHVICTCHLHVHIIHMHTCHPHVIRMSSAALLMVSVDLNYLSTLTGTGYWMEFVARMLSYFISGSYKWFVR